METETYRLIVEREAMNRIHSYLTKKIYLIRDQICNPKSVLMDLTGDALIRCWAKVDHEKLKNIYEVRAAIYRQAKDVFCEYWKNHHRRKKFFNELKTFASQIHPENHAEDFELKDILEFLRRRLGEPNYNLFYFHFFENRPFKELAEHFNKKAATLRQLYRNIKARVINLLQKKY